MARHNMSKMELLRRFKEVKDIKANAGKAPFTGMATLCNYVLWKEEKWYQKKLAEYNQRVNECDRMMDDGEITLEEIQKRLWDKGGFEVRTVDEVQRHSGKTRSFAQQMEREIVEANNQINDMSCRYILIHYQVLMDMGYGHKRLNRNMKYINSWLARVNHEGDMSIMQLHRELFEEAGIFIEMPNLRG